MTTILAEHALVGFQHRCWDAALVQFDVDFTSCGRMSETTNRNNTVLLMAISRHGASYHIGSANRTPRGVMNANKQRGMLGSA